MVYKSPLGTSGNVSLKWSYVEVSLLAEEKFQCSWEWRLAVRRGEMDCFFLDDIFSFSWRSEAGSSRHQDIDGLHLGLPGKIQDDHPIFSLWYMTVLAK